MYVCVCKAVSDRAIRRSVAEEGVCTLKQLKDRFGLGSVCGRCVPETRTLIQQARVAGQGRPGSNALSEAA